MASTEEILDKFEALQNKLGEFTIQKTDFWGDKYWEFLGEDEPFIWNTTWESSSPSVEDQQVKSRALDLILLFNRLRIICIQIMEDTIPQSIDSGVYITSILPQKVADLAQVLVDITNDSLFMGSDSAIPDDQGDYELNDYIDPDMPEEVMGKLMSVYFSEIIENEIKEFAEVALLPAIYLSRELRQSSEGENPGGAIILSDPELEASLSINYDYEHYIGFHMNPGRSYSQEEEENLVSAPYIPVRFSPHNNQLRGNLTRPNDIEITKKPLAGGWDQDEYYLINSDGEGVVRESNSLADSNGIQLPLGTPVIITEIVEGATGLWVGFIPVTEEERWVQTPVNWWVNEANFFTDNYEDIEEPGKVLYTRPEFIRKIDGSNFPDPLIKFKSYRTDIAKIFGARPYPEVELNDGSKLISESGNFNWTTLNPLDVRMSYFNFNKYNEKEAELLEKKLLISKETIDTNPILRFSEGYYYFIVGEGKRPTTEDIAEEQDSEDPAEASDTEETEEEAKEAKSLEVSNEIKYKTFQQLLRYFNKDNTETDLLGQVREKYFAPVATRVSANSANPNNQQVLFAIPVSYIDSLPDSRKQYNNIFQDNSQFINGKNYAFSIRLGELQKRSDQLVTIFEDLKTKLKSFEDEGGVIRNPYDVPYDIDAQIKSLKAFPGIINDFLSRQAFPNSTNYDEINLLAASGIENSKSNRNLLQIGIKDNGEIGEGVREVVSHVLFSPDPDVLWSDTNNPKNELFEFEPYITDEEMKDLRGAKRSAMILGLGVEYLRREIAGSISAGTLNGIPSESSIYGSRTLHYMMYSDAIIKYNKSVSSDSKFETKDWVKFLQSFSVPPLKIYLSKDRAMTPEEYTCEEIIDRLNSSSNVSGLEEQKLQELLYNNPTCMEKYFNDWSKPTPATDAESSRAGLEEKSKKLEEASSNSHHWANFKVFYTAVLNSLDPQALMALLMGCFQKQFGLAFTAEALCEAAIIEMIEADPLGFKDVLVNASPELAIALGFASASEAYLGKDVQAIVDKYEEEGTVDDGSGEISATSNNTTSTVEIDASFEGAPIATSMKLTGQGNDNLIDIIKSLEKGGTSIELEPALRPVKYGEIVIPEGFPGNIAAYSGEVDFGVGEGVYTFSGSVSERYTWKEINREKIRLAEMGYSKSEINALLVQNGFLVIKETAYESFLSGEAWFGPLGELADTLGDQGMNNAAIGMGYFAKGGKETLEYIKRFVDLQTLCELIVGPILEFPNALFDLNFTGWSGDFLEGLKRHFTFNIPTLSMPWGMSTDDMIGDYGQKLLEAFLGMIGQMLGQILHLLIRQALEKCLEEDASASSSSPNSLDSLDSEEIPKLTNAASPFVNLPPESNVNKDDIFNWLAGLADAFSTSQLCSLLKGEASNSVLRQCAELTKELNPDIYKYGYDSGTEIQSVFKKVGALPGFNLDFCNTILATQPIVVNSCDLRYDMDEKIQELKEQGMTEDEAKLQALKELQDMKDKIMDLASLLFPDKNPLVLPDLCGPNGIFQVPDAVVDTMDRVTDNILLNVKGSLLQDMRAFKFFTMPSRALSAVTDPEELANTYELFSDTIRDPNKQICFCYVGPNALVWNTGTHLDYGKLTNYNLTYNEEMHFRSKMYAGNALRFGRPSRDDIDVLLDYGFTEGDVNKIKNGKFGGGKTDTEIRGDGDLAFDKGQYKAGFDSFVNANLNRSSSRHPGMLEDKYFRFLTTLGILYEPEDITYIETSPNWDPSDHHYPSEFYFYAHGAPETDELPELFGQTEIKYRGICGFNNLGPHVTTWITQHSSEWSALCGFLLDYFEENDIQSEFVGPVPLKPWLPATRKWEINKGLHNSLIEYYWSLWYHEEPEKRQPSGQEFMYYSADMMGSSEEFSFGPTYKTEDRHYHKTSYTNANYAEKGRTPIGLPVGAQSWNVSSMPEGPSSRDPNMTKNWLSRIWPLHTKLKDITPNPYYWMHLYSLFTGLDARYPFDKWTAFRYGDTSSAELYVFIPGYRFLVNHPIAQAVAVDEDDNSQIINLLNVFMELTLGEATGLTPSRISMLYPNIMHSTIKGLVMTLGPRQNVCASYSAQGILWDHPPPAAISVPDPWLNNNFYNLTKKYRVKKGTSNVDAWTSYNGNLESIGDLAPGESEYEQHLKTINMGEGFTDWSDLDIKYDNSMWVYVPNRWRIYRDLWDQSDIYGHSNEIDIVGHTPGEPIGYYTPTDEEKAHQGEHYHVVGVTFGDVNNTGYWQYFECGQDLDNAIHEARMAWERAGHSPGVLYHPDTGGVIEYDELPPIAQWGGPQIGEGECASWVYWPTMKGIVWGGESSYHGTEWDDTQTMEGPIEISYETTGEYKRGPEGGDFRMTKYGELWEGHVHDFAPPLLLQPEPDLALSKGRNYYEFMAFFCWLGFIDVFRNSVQVNTKAHKEGAKTYSYLDRDANGILDINVAMNSFFDTNGDALQWEWENLKVFQYQGLRREVAEDDGMTWAGYRLRRKTYLDYSPNMGQAQKCTGKKLSETVRLGENQPGAPGATIIGMDAVYAGAKYGDGIYSGGKIIGAFGSGLVGNDGLHENEGPYAKELQEIHDKYVEEHEDDAWNASEEEKLQFLAELYGVEYEYDATDPIVATGEEEQSEATYAGHVGSTGLANAEKLSGDVSGDVGFAPQVDNMYPGIRQTKPGVHWRRVIPSPTQKAFLIDFFRFPEGDEFRKTLHEPDVVKVDSDNDGIYDTNSLEQSGETMEPGVNYSAGYPVQEEIIAGGSIYDQYAAEIKAEEEKALQEATDPANAKTLSDGTVALRTAHRVDFFPRFVPLMLAFEQFFKDPNFVFNKDSQEWGSLSLNMNRRVSPQLDTALINEQEFSGIFSSAPILGAANFIDEKKNFNPNILNYTLPFKEVALKNSKAADATAEITNLFNNLKTTGDEITSMTSQLQFINDPKNLTYQNVKLPLQSNIFNLEMRDNFNLFKSKINFQQKEDDIPPAIISSEEALINPIYNFDFSTRFSDKVLGLIDRLFPDIDTEGRKSGKVDEIFTNLQKIRTSVDHETEKIWVRRLRDSHSHWGPNNPYVINQLNFKSQIFGKLLRTKFEETYSKYIQDSADEKAFDVIEYALASYGYTGLQYAYSSQMFARLSKSRLNNMKFYRKMWKKLLETPGAGDGPGGTDPACAALFDQLSIVSTKDLQRTETDFFNIDDIKEEIKEYYKKSICKDVFDKNADGVNSVKTSLQHGVVKLIAKIYSLELCMASIIAWDSFSLKDIIDDDLFPKIVIRNIRQEVKDIAILTEFATDIIKKEMGYEYFEQWDKLKTNSSLEQLIRLEAIKISDIVEKLFQAGRRAKTGLNLNIMKNSDPDFINDYKRRFPETVQRSPGDNLPLDFVYASAEEISALYDKEQIEYVVQCEFTDNIYTMNYGYCYQVDPSHETTHDLIQYAGQSAQYEILNLEQKPVHHKVANGVYKRSMRPSLQRNVLYSLPLTLIYNSDIGDISTSPSLINPEKHLIMNATDSHKDLPLSWTEDQLEEALKLENIDPDDQQAMAHYLAGHNNYDVKTPKGWGGSRGTKGEFFRQDYGIYFPLIKSLYEEFPSWMPSKHLSTSLYQKSILEQPTIIKNIDYIHLYSAPKHDLDIVTVDLGGGGSTDVIGAEMYWNPHSEHFEETWKIEEEPHAPADYKRYLSHRYAYAEHPTSLSNFRKAGTFSKENVHEFTWGSTYNQQLGNMIIQTFVKVTERDPNTYDQFKIPVDFDQQSGVPIAEGDDLCDKPVPLYESAAGILGDFFEDLRQYREGGNEFRCHIYDYVPLPVWSHFYSNVFMPSLYGNEHPMPAIPEGGGSWMMTGEPLDPLSHITLNTEKQAKLQYLFNTYGLEPFFENIEYGLRLTYVGSYGLTNPPGVRVPDIFQGKEGAISGIKKCKSLYSTRACTTRSTFSHSEDNGNIALYDEVHIPIVEVTTGMTFNPDGFKIAGDHRTYSYDELSPAGMGSYLDPGWVEQKKLSNLGSSVKHITNNFNQFFYKKVVDGDRSLITELQNTAEFKLLFDHLFPMKRYMTLAFLYAGDGLSKFIPEPTAILEQSKSALNNTFEALLNSDDYTFQPDPLVSLLERNAIRTNAGTAGKEPDLTQQILMILLRTPLLILKGFVEITDPAIIIAKKIIDVANMITMTVIAAIEQGLKAIKQGIQMAIQQAESTLMTLESNLGMMTGQLNTLKLPLKPLFLQHDADIDTIIVINTPQGDIESWEVHVQGGAIASNPALKEALKDNKKWKQLQKSIDEIGAAIDDYKAVKEKIVQLKEELAQVEEDLEVAIAEAKEIAKAVFSSPFMLPGVWAALLPSILPYFGGVVPPPWVIGPPSTVPGMIYLVLLFLDLYEEKMHDAVDDAIGNKDGCEDEL